MAAQVKHRYAEEPTTRSTRMSEICGSVIEAGWLMAVILAPLFFNVYSSRHVEADKLAVLHVIVVVMIATWLLKTVDRFASGDRSRGALWQMPLTLPILAVGAVYLLSTLTSVAPRVSLLGQYVRPEGTQTILAYIAVCLLLAHHLRTRAQLDRLIGTIVMTSLPIAAYAILQRLGWDPLTWSGDVSARVGATLGNPIFLAAYLIMAFFLAVGAALQSLATLRRLPRSERPKRLAARVACFGLVAALQAVAIVLSVSRGPWVGWLIGLFVFAVLWAATCRQRQLVLGLIGLGAAGALFIGVLNLPESPLAALRADPYLGALGRVFDGESGTGQVRTLIWEGDVHLMLQGTSVLRPDGTPDPLRTLRPVLGYGPDTLYLVFRQVAPPQLLAVNSPDTLTVRSHNETWDTLVTIGGLGLVAYQLLFGGLFLNGMKSLGLIATRRQRNAFVAAWVGLGLVGAALVLLVGRAEYLGVAIPAGNLLGVVTYLVIATFINHGTPEGDDRPGADHWLVIALLAGVAAHYIEIQFGQAITATRVMFWVCAGLLMALGSAHRSPAFDAPEKPFTSAVHYAFVIAAILSTLLYEFVTRNYGLSDPLAILWRALTFDSVHDTSSYATLALLAVTWLATTGIAASYMARPGTYAAVAVSSLSLSAVFGLGLAMLLASLRAVPASDAQTSDLLALHSGLTSIFGYFVISRLTLMVLFSAGRWLEPATRSLRWTAIPRRAWAGLPVLLALCIGLSAAAIAPINADIAYQLGVDYDASPGAAIGAYAHATASQPQQDAYYPALAHALVYQALSTQSDAASVFGDETRFEDVLALETDRLVSLNRSDLLFAAQAVFLRARSLNPLYAAHSVNLARFYIPSLPVDTPAKRHLVELSDQYYAESLRLDPNDARLWNEWADFALAYRNDAGAALDALSASLALDAQFAPTYLIACDAYLAQDDLDAAEQAIDRALALQPDWPEAVSKQAFVYFRQGRFEDAIAAYTHYIQIAPNAPDTWEAHKNIALLREQLGDVAGAIDAARVTAELAPDDARPQLADLIDRLNAQLARP